MQIRWEGKRPTPRRRPEADHSSLEEAERETKQFPKTKKKVNYPRMTMLEHHCMSLWVSVCVEKLQWRV